MNTIVISGDTADEILLRTVTGSCRRYGAVSRIHQGILETDQTAPRYLIVGNGSLQEISGGGILLMGEGSAVKVPRFQEGIQTVVLDPSNQEALSAVSALHVPVIGCSMSGKETVSLSCRSEDSALVCLQRSIVCMDGTVLDPCEIKVHTGEPIPPYPLMAACVALLLCGVPCDSGMTVRIEDHNDLSVGRRLGEKIRFPG